MKFQKEFALLKEAGRGALSMRKVMKFQVSKGSTFETGINPVGQVSYAKHVKKSTIGQRKTTTTCQLSDLDIKELLGYWKENMK